MTLAQAEKGATVRVVRRGTGRGLHAHLDGLGIHVGDELRVLASAPFHGPVLVEVVRTGVRVALGHGMAERVEVAPVTDGAVQAEEGTPAEEEGRPARCRQHRWGPRR